jgi:katanin p60 ATPase-containing subunit A1
MPVDLSAQTYATFKAALRRAKGHQERGSLREAAAAYRQCSSLMAKYADYAVSPKAKASREEKAKAYRALADQLDSGKVPVPAAEGPIGPEDYEGEIAGLIHKSAITWDDIGGLEETKREIKAAYGLTLAKKPNGVRLSGWEKMLFYGPPGTGKTLLAAATSNGLEATFFSVKVSNLLSKYFGESTKLISALYQHARERSPSVIFLDEFDSLSVPRGMGDSGAERRVVSTMLAELDGLSGKDSKAYVLTIGATNVPWLVDKALLSRFEKKILVPLPDAAARRRIFEINLHGRGHQTSVPLDPLVKQTERFSGRELDRLCREAVTHMIRNMNPGLLDEVDKGLDAIEQYQIRVRPLTEADLDHALRVVEPETSEADLKRFEEWRKGLD